MSISLPVTVTYLNAGGSLSLPGQDSVSKDQVGNVTIAFVDPHIPADSSSMRTYLEALQGKLATRVQQKQTKSGELVVIAPTNTEPCELSWVDVNPWAGEAETKTARGALMVTSIQSSIKQGERFSLVLYVCDTLNWLDGTSFEVGSL